MITVAAGFPTTVAPILQVGAVPVFIDNDPVTGNARVDQLEAAYVEGKTKAVMMAHTLGNPFDIGAVLAFCHKHDLWLIEDNCDALGCTYSMPVEQAKTLGLDHLLKQAEAGTHPLIRFETDGSRPSALDARLLTAPTGAWGDISTQSFYPPHHLTMGEGGAVGVSSSAETCFGNRRSFDSTKTALTPSASSAAMARPSPAEELQLQLSTSTGDLASSPLPRRG